ncbi:MAG: hypothetical protein ACRC5C_08560 [Bacilli bacterium]
MKEIDVRKLATILIARAKESEIITLPDLAKQFRQDSAAVKWAKPLQTLALACTKLNLPPLSMIVVNPSTKMPERSLTKAVAPEVGYPQWNPDDEMVIAIEQMNKVFAHSNWETLMVELYAGGVTGTNNSWIFQGDQESFDMDGYLTGSTIIFWPLKQTYHQKNLRVGDTVFFAKRYGRDRERGGIVGRGTVIDKLETRNDWKEEEAGLYVPIRVETYEADVVKVKRQTLAHDDLFAVSKYTKMPFLTNFALTRPEAIRLNTYWFQPENERTDTTVQASPVADNMPKTNLTNGDGQPEHVQTTSKTTTESKKPTFIFTSENEGKSADSVVRATTEPKKPAFTFTSENDDKPADSVTRATTEPKKPMFTFTSENDGKPDASVTRATTEPKKPAFTFTSENDGKSADSMARTSTESKKPAFTFTSENDSKPTASTIRTTTETKKPALTFTSEHDNKSLSADERQASEQPKSVRTSEPIEKKEVKLTTAAHDGARTPETKVTFTMDGSSNDGASRQTESAAVATEQSERQLIFSVNKSEHEGVSREEHRDRVRSVTIEHPVKKQHDSEQRTAFMLTIEKLENDLWRYALVEGDQIVEAKRCKIAQRAEMKICAVIVKKLYEQGKLRSHKQLSVESPNLSKEQTERLLRQAYRAVVVKRLEQTIANDLAQQRTRLAGNHPLLTLEDEVSMRARIVAEKGTTCSVCQFDFAEKYGEIGELYVELYNNSDDFIDETNWTPVCANCHAMLVRGQEQDVTVEQLRQRLND